MRCGGDSNNNVCSLIVSSMHDVNLHVYNICVHLEGYVRLCFLSEVHAISELVDMMYIHT